MTKKGRALIMTVGTGDVDRVEETLFTPLRKSIATEAWVRVVLLPSRVTEEFARALQDQINGAEVDVAPLPAGDENDADAAYAHFDHVLATVLDDFAPEDVVVDFTRGTKAMSAALVLAATRRAVPCLRYITGRRDRRGMVEPGSEQVREIRTTAVDGHRRLDLAREHMRRGAFAAVANALPDPDAPLAWLYPDDFLHAARAVRTTARFYAAWDRLDYASAVKIDAGEPPSSEWTELWPTERMRGWVRDLEREPERSDHRAMAARLRRLVIDLIANGERRIRHGQHEDALVRAYRALELLGQARLFDWSLDSGDLDGAHRAVQAVQRKIAMKGQDPIGKGRGDKLQAARQQVARILKECGDPLAERLLQFEQETLLKPTLRNNSVLVHGFVARAPGEPNPLRRLFREIAAIAVEDAGEEAAARFRTARSISFGFS